MPQLQLSPKGHRYGLLSSLPDHAAPGFPSHLVKAPAPSAWPRRAFVSGRIPKVKNQGTQGSCDGHACCSFGERLYLRWKPQVGPVVFSPAFAYAMERILEGTFTQGDVGAMISSAVQVPDPKAGGFGWCPLTDMPYDENVCNVRPNAAQIATAAQYPGGAFHTIGNVIANIKSCILSDYTAVIGVAVYDSFESDDAARTGLIPYPNLSRETLQGGHALHALIGYDDDIRCPGAPNPGAVWFENSWDVTWGTKCPVSDDPGGFGLLSYDFLANPNLTTDVKMGHLGKAWE